MVWIVFGTSQIRKNDLKSSLGKKENSLKRKIKDVFWSLTQKIKKVEIVIISIKTDKRLNMRHMWIVNGISLRPLFLSHSWPPLTCFF